MHPQDVGARGFRRLPLLQVGQQAAGQQLIGNGIEPLRALGMPVAHFMQAA
ncbi:Uncharacterised protein [Bordetella pertussis]|nr:Uncharacterised protein [Bordetella pertussis]